MTRDTKLALVVGFALILAVGVLISDHFASGSRTPPADLALGDRAPTPVARDLARHDARVPARIEDRRSSVVGSGGPAAARPGAEEPGRPTPSLPVRIVQGSRGSLVTPSPHRSGDGDDVRPLLPHERSRLNAASGVALADLDSALREVQRKASEQRVPESVGGQGSGRERATPPPSASSPAGQQEQGGRWHIVGEGESLWKIAQREYGKGTLWKRIAEANPDRVQPDGTVRRGVRLRLPSPASLGVEPPPTRRPPRAAPETRPSRRDGPRAKRYVVGKGETLSEIAQKVLGRASRMEEILELNRELIADPDEIRAGMVLRLPK